LGAESGIVPPNFVHAGSGRSYGGRIEDLEGRCYMLCVDFSVGQADAGLRVERFLAPRLPLLSRTKLRVLLAAGSVLRDGQAVSAGVRLRAGDRLQVSWDPRQLPAVLPEDLPIRCVYADESLVAVDKPPGMLMHATSGVKRGTLCNALLAMWNPWLHEELLVNYDARPVVWPHFVQRLDRETSGLLVAARHADAAAKLGRLFAERRVQKGYLAILEGEMTQPDCTVAEPIARVSEEPPHWQRTEEGAEARSTITVIATAGGKTLALLQPHTGRTNQLRIHCGWAGHAILGDVAYGAAAAERLFLHSWRLRVAHPVSGDPLLLEAAVPESFLAAWPGEWPVLPDYAARHRGGGALQLTD
jgi:23S rRNA pseudouridine1911/1915/1917 synthase